jgi:Flp pilus assembly protein TadD
VRHQSGQDERALEDLERAIQLNSHDSEGYELRAEVLTALGREDDARLDRETAEQLREGEEES